MAGRIRQGYLASTVPIRIPKANITNTIFVASDTERLSLIVAILSLVNCRPV